MDDDRKVHPSELLEFKTSNLSTLAPVASDGHAAPKTQVKTRETSQHAEFVDSPRGSLHLNQETFDATNREHRMTFIEGMKLYPKAVCWSILISSAIIMEGFDTALINSFYAFVQFRQAYGVPTADGGYQITAKWQTSLNNGGVAGSIIGLFANGVLTEKFGYRKTMIGALILLALCISLSFFAVSIQMLLAGQIMCSLSWGVFSTLTTTYAAEVMPLNLRAYLTANVNLCWLIGQVIAVGSLRGLVNLHSAWSYRIPFGLQWAWIATLLVIAFLAPESPWWLVRNKRLKEAEHVLIRLTRRGFDYDAKSIVAIMDYTNTTEKRMNGEHRHDMSYLQCFKGSNLRRTEIVCAIFAIQNLCGLPVIAFAAYFYNRLGFNQRRSFDLTLGMQAVAILGAFVSWPLMNHFGRRSLYMTGLSVQVLVLAAAGVVSCFEETTATLWVTASLIILFIFVFDCAVGPLTYCIVAEIPSTRLRVKSVVLARVSYNLCALVTNVLETRMLNPLDWNWRGKSCFFWAGACLLCLVYCYFRLPDTRGLTYLELDILFEKGAKAKQFSELQKRLSQSGYFSFRDQESRRPQWAETRTSDAVKIQPLVEKVDK